MLSPALVLSCSERSDTETQPTHKLGPPKRTIGTARSPPRTMRLPRFTVVAAATLAPAANSTASTRTSANFFNSTRGLTCSPLFIGDATSLAGTPTSLPFEAGEKRRFRASLLTSGLGETKAAALRGLEGALGLTDTNGRRSSCLRMANLSSSPIHAKDKTRLPESTEGETPCPEVSDTPPNPEAASLVNKLAACKISYLI
mmetsp:Transcript_14492/g.31197  ORF Transcript_14492/g.31197 Transcript_14492/m.31197 type:complete len:201 (+) Transcript_14492:86-688(+)